MRRLATIIDFIRQDARYALRSLVRHRGFSIVAAATLAIGIGANTAIFSVVDAVLLAPLPYADPARLMVVWETMPDNDKRGAAPANFLDWRRESRAFSGLAGYFATTRTLTTGDAPERVRTASVSGNLFSLLGAVPAIGRTFVPSEDASGAADLAVLGDGMWRSRFGADPSIVGRTIRLDDRSIVVVGVMRPDFRFPERVELWTIGVRGVPALSGFPEDITVQRDIHYFTVIGRLAPGVAENAAQREMSAIARRIGQRFPDNAELGVNVEPLRQAVVGDTRAPLLMLLGAVGFVLLIACTNVANLVIARASARGREFAIRTAIGATRRRLLAQVLTESVMLSAVGGALGVALAAAGTRLLVAASPIELPSVAHVAIDPRALAFTALLALVTGLLFGMIPALHVSGVSVERALRDASAKSTGGQSKRRARSALAVAEIALSLALLIGAGLFVKSFARLLAVDPGFRPEHLLTMQLSLSPNAYGEKPRQAAFFDRLMERAASLPGVRSVGVVSNLPIGGGSMNRGVRIDGRPSPRANGPTTEYQSVGGAYFATMGIPLRAGRLFGAEDAPTGAPVAVIDEALAQRYFPGENPIGRRLGFGSPSGDVQRTIVGVVGDVRHFGLDQAAEPEVYVPVHQDPNRTMTIAIRTISDPEALVPAMRAAVRNLDPAQPISSVATMDQRLADSVARPRFLMLLLAAFAVVALFLASLGVYAIMATNVESRRREIGVRLALGARPLDVLRQVMGEGGRLVAAGVLTGLAMALGATRLLSSLLFGVAPSDPMTFAAMTTLLVGIAMLATWLPARRAARVDPLVALRAES